MPPAEGNRVGAIESVRDITDRRDADAALRESEELYHQLADMLPEAVVVHTEGKVRYVNRAAIRLFGYDEREDWEGADLLSRLHPDYRAPTAERIRRLYEEHVPLERQEAVLLRKDGTPFLAETAGGAITYRGKPAGLAVITDITERRRAERALRESEERYRALYADIPSMYFTVDAGGIVLSVNEYGASQLGYTPGELEGDSVLRVFPPEQREAAREHLAACLADPGTVHTWELRKVRRDGALLDVRETARAVRDRQGQPIVLIVCEDITDRKVADAALRDSEERYRRITEAVTDYLFTVRFRDGRPAGTVHGAGCVAVTGYTSDEYTADPDLWLRMVVPEDRAAVLAYSARIAAGEHVEPLEHRIFHKDGRVRWVRDTIVPQFDADGTLVSYDGLIEDITERRSLQDQLVQAQKMEAIGRLAGGVAHDFNNLLTSISGYSSLIRDTLAADDPRLADITEIDRAATRGAALTRQLLAFSRRQIVAPAVFDPNRSIAEMAPMLRRLLGEDIALAADLGSTGNVCMDPGQFGQVVLNLAVNARDAMPDGGTLTIGTADADMDLAQGEASQAAPGRWVLVTVSDSGKGMDAATLAQVFEPFFTTKALGKGTGLGLATVYGIVKQAGGYIWASSEPGRGATFSTYLPRIEAPVEEPAEQRAADVPRGGTETILVVEDDPAVRTFARQVLERSGYTVLWAGSPKAALALVRAPHGTIDLLFTDVVMPGMNGRVLAERLSAMLPGIRAVFTSGYTENGIVRDGVLEHDVRYLAKPYSGAELLAAVRAALDAPQG